MKKALFILTCIFVNCYAAEKISMSEIDYYLTGNNPPFVMIISGIHGDEISGIEMTKKIIAESNIKKLSKDSFVIIPEANKEAVKHNNRTEYYMEDLNRAFYYKRDEKTFKITTEIIEVIKKYSPVIILDLHESYYNYDENKTPDFYIGNTIIFQNKTTNRYPELIFEIVEEGFIPLEGAPKGSLNKEISERLNIPVITIETSREDSMKQRKEKYKKILNIVLKYFKME